MDYGINVGMVIETARKLKLKLEKIKIEKPEKVQPKHCTIV